jgi:hypothetical protein
VIKSKSGTELLGGLFYSQPHDTKCLGGVYSQLARDAYSLVKINSISKLTITYLYAELPFYFIVEITLLFVVLCTQTGMRLLCASESLRSLQ